MSTIKSPLVHKTFGILAALSLTVVSVAVAAPAKPNIIFLLADDLGYMDIGANNPKTFYETPNIDAIAAKGERFTAGYAACPVCSPTRASLMTGQYPARTGVTDYIPGMRNAKLLSAPNAMQLALEQYTIAEALRDAGYTNFFAGKWHLGTGKFGPGAQGFSPALVQVGEGFHPPGNFPPLDKKADPKASDRIADEAVKFIEENKDKAFFAYLPFHAVHVPIGARPDLVEKYEKKKASGPADAWGQERANKVRLVQNNAVYAGMIEQLDTAIGRVLAAVNRAGIADHTIIIFFSDNGGLATAEGHSTSNLPLRGGKGWPYEGGVREPWIVYAPGLTQAGSLCDTPVTSTDFYPTLLQLAGLPLNPQQHRDGVSIVPLLKGGELNRGPLFWHYPHYGNQGGAPFGAVRDGDWKLIEWYEDGSLELYNLRNDIGEKNNLAAANPGKVKELHAKLVAWRKDVGALMPKPNPEWDPVTKTCPNATPGKKGNSKKIDTSAG